LVERIAIKQLSRSDCTLFEAVFRRIGAGNQKSINLNADVLTGIFYPNLAAVAAESDNEITVKLSLYGPGGKGVHKVTRKIIKNDTYKNWRLDGEFIYGPSGDTSRYDEIGENDLAILFFKGEAFPFAIDLILISQNDLIDLKLHDALTPLFASKSMVAVTSRQIAFAANSAGIPETHPVFIAAADPELDAALEDAAQGGYEGGAKLLVNKNGRKISGSDFARAKAKAELTGREGEGLVNGYMAAALAAGTIGNYVWCSIDNAIERFDFKIWNAAGQLVLIDVKTTGGRFYNPIHLSLAEVIEASGPIPYLIYRVFEIDSEGGKLRVSDDIGPFARNLKSIHEAHMPAGVRVDGFSVEASSLNWGPEEYVARADDDEQTT
jgi:hypothetical protein